MIGKLTIDKNYENNGAHSDCACSTVDIDQLILQTKVTEVMLAEQLKNELYHGETCEPNAKHKVGLLQSYRYHLEDEQFNRRMGGEGCFSCEELQSFFELINKITATCDVAKSRPDLEVDKTNVDGWILQNPYCVAREKWEYLAYEILCNIQLEVEVLETSQMCDLTLEIATENIPCDITVAIDVYNKNCDLTLNIDATDAAQCQLELEHLIGDFDCVEGMSLHAEKMGNEITLDEYTALLEANVSPSIIAVVYENGCCLSTNNEQVMLHTETGSYPLDSIKFSDAPNFKELERYGVDVSKSKYLENPEAFVQNLNKDYSETT